MFNNTLFFYIFQIKAVHHEKLVLHFFQEKVHKKLHCLFPKGWPNEH